MALPVQVVDDELHVQDDSAAEPMMEDEIDFF